MVFKQRRLSITKKLTLTYSVILFGILIAYTILIVFFIRGFMLNSAKSDLVTSIEIISQSLSNMQSLEQSSFKNINLSHNVFYSVFDKGKKLLYSNNPELPFKTIILETKNNGFQTKVFEHTRKILYASEMLTSENTIFYVLVAKDYEDIIDKVDMLPGLLIIISIFGTMVSLVSGSFFIKKLLKPVQDIAKTAKEITSNNLDNRILIDGPDDELKDLADIFNSMITRLEEDFEKHKRFVSDVSHELRTPLAIIHGHVNMLDRWGKNDFQVLSHSLKTIKSETDNMNMLIQNLLYFTKGDNKLLVMKREELFLSLLLKEVVDETILTNSQFTVAYKAEEYLTINADYNALKQVFRILLDNSIKFSTPPGEILIQAEQKDRGTLIKVMDHGVGIPPECLPYIFDRFYRVDESRSKATGGTGLGLSIAKQIVQSHNGTISAESELGQGTTVAVCIPHLVV